MGLLLIDAGNTRIKWALTDAPSAADATNATQDAPVWREYGSVAHSEMADLATFWHGLHVSRALISNVAGNLIGER